MIPQNITPTALGNAIAVLPTGSNYANLTTNGYTQVKTGLGVLSGLVVNTAGSGSSAKLYDGTSSTVTITLAAPGVVSWPAHGLVAGSAVVFQTTGGLPTGLVAGTIYYVSSAGLTANSFSVSDTKAHGIAGTNMITTSVSQSGVQTAYNVSNLIGTFATVAQASLPFGSNGIQVQNGIIAFTAGGGAADLSLLFI